MSLANCGLFSELNPLTCIKIYNSVVLPKALYGCESWSQLSVSNIIHLERAHRFCIKYMQGFGIRTRTDVALGLLGVLPLESEVDFKKLNLLGQLCRNDTHCWITPVFRIRLESYFVNPTGQMGFFRDIMRLLEKYGLSEYIETYKMCNIFPSKLIWKRVMKQRIWQYETVQWQNRITNTDFSLFSRLHNVYEPHIFWHSAKENPQSSCYYKSVMQMIALVSNNFRGPFICSYCKSQYVNLVEHCIHECIYLAAERILLVTNVYMFNAAVFALLCSLDRTSQTLVLLGENIAPLNAILGDEIHEFCHLCAVNLHRMWSKIYYCRFR